MDDKRLQEIERRTSELAQSGVDMWDTVELIAEVRRLQSLSLNIFGMRVRFDPNVPTGTAEIRERSGKVLGRLSNE